MNPDRESSRLEQLQALSALVDGDDSQAEQACRAWRDDAAARADWHVYHLIGEVLRSDEVHCAPQRDAAFLNRLRRRLAAEPVVLAPVAAPPRTLLRRTWMAPVAVAAGFVIVAGVLVVTRMAAPQGAASEPGSLLAGTSAAPSAASAASTLVADSVLIRNAELDRYLAAHKQYSSTSALAMPGGMVRNVAAVAPGR
jgi:sigma-E factor negative regulatory protein RseA